MSHVEVVPKEIPIQAGLSVSCVLTVDCFGLCGHNLCRMSPVLKIQGFKNYFVSPSVICHLGRILPELLD